MKSKPREPKPPKARVAMEMFPTTVKLPEEIRARAKVAADARGESLHAFLQAAVELLVSESEKRREFVAEAKAAEVRLMSTGNGIPHADVAKYLRGRAAGKNPTPPKAVQWRK